MTTGPHHLDSPIAAVDLGTDPVAMIGRGIRRSTRTTPRWTPWAQIVMTVPSRNGPCLLVTFIDGNVDVWRTRTTNSTR